MIADVTKKNFCECLPLIKQSIREAVFVSIDFEFLGLAPEKGNGSVSLFDSPYERYEKLCDVVRHFPPCQLGLACFRETEKGYVADVFSITLRKRNHNEKFSISVAATEFLTEHGLDFNKVLYEGISYCNRRQMGNIADLIGQRGSDCRLLNEFLGASPMFQWIVEAKVPIVLHNSLLDLLHLYYCFHDDLPDEYEKWKKEIHSLLPTIIDTKILAASLREELSTAGCSVFTLETLENFLTSENAEKILPFRIPIDYDRSEVDGIDLTKESYHNAAFDAFITGKVFLKLAHIFISKRCVIKLEEPWTVRRLILACRKDVVNRIYVPMIDAGCFYLEGKDPPGHRPDIIRVARNRHPCNESGLLRAITRTPILIWDWLMGPPRIQPEDFEEVQEHFLVQLHKHQINIRLAKGDRIIEIATNTATTFAHVCQYFSSPEKYPDLAKYKIIGDTGQTFEQRLIAPRVEKDRAMKSTPNLSFRTTITVLTMLLTSGMWTGYRLYQFCHV
ncbi:unnamed protein product [Cylicocyclus nassatus]|uniref:Uncharacterized protein n=1 Tax=Cylicocyclus nassatus TaxID=53992 RepID=A0AA36DQW9_CYLNA|nr:unnamed protein product [Cylicocyclus nassatus]